MRKLFTTCILSLLLILTLPLNGSKIQYLSGSAPAPSEIVWNSQYKLSWDDFQAPPPATKMIGAATHTNIRVKPKVRKKGSFKVDVQVQAVFACHKSWAKDEAKDHDHLLNHEQRHFDMAELYARKIRRELRKYKITSKNYAQIKRTVIMPLFREFDQHDRAYDRDTVHGLDSDAQADWDSRIDKKLQQLSAY